MNARTPAEAVEILSAAAGSGEVKRFRGEHGLRLLVLFGSAADPRQIVDVAVSITGRIAATLLGRAPREVQQQRPFPGSWWEVLIEGDPQPRSCCHAGDYAAAALPALSWASSAMASPIASSLTPGYSSAITSSG